MLIRYERNIVTVFTLFNVLFYQPIIIQLFCTVVSTLKCSFHSSPIFQYYNINQLFPNLSQLSLLMTRGQLLKLDRY